MKKLILFVGLTIAVLVSGCSFTQTSNYQISDIGKRVSLEGCTFKIGGIKYLPFEKGQARSTEVVNKTTLPGFGHDFNFDKPIAEIVESALVNELNAAGSEEYSQSKNVIYAEIVEASMAVRGLGYGGWRLFYHAKLQVQNTSGQVTYSRDFGQMTKTHGAAISVSESWMVIIRESIATLINDHDFQVALKG